LRSVVHVLPHPGWGNETYVDVLAAMDGWRQIRFALTGNRRPVPAAMQIARGMPAVMRAARPADVIHLHGEVASSLCLPILPSRPSVWTTHGLHLVRRLSGARRRAAEAALRAIVKATDRTLCVAETEREELLELLPERLAEKVVAVPNGLPLPPRPTAEQKERARAEVGIAGGSVAVLYVGQLEQRKDPLVAVRAAALARARGAPVELLIVGDGPLAAAVAAEASDGVRWLGPRDDVGRLLEAADAFVLPSHREGLSYALLEAMAHGLPALAADVPGNAEALGTAGVLLPPGDVAAFAEALMRLANDPAERRRLGELADERVRERFSAERMIAATRVVYEQVVGS
jgi:glycosyltransferase involved in cell wall biosynthesis